MRPLLPSASLKYCDRSATATPLLPSARLWVGMVPAVVGAVLVTVRSKESLTEAVPPLSVAVTVMVRLPLMAAVRVRVGLPPTVAWAAVATALLGGVRLWL